MGMGTVIVLGICVLIGTKAGMLLIIRLRGMKPM